MHHICSLIRREVLTVSPLALFTRPFCSGLGNDDLSPRFNPVNIQMLSKLLHSQLFPGTQQPNDSKVIEKSIEHLKEHNLWGKNKNIIPDVNFKLPKLLGANIDEHFKTIAKQQSQPYFDICEDLSCSLLPRQPEEWAFVSGWSKYEVSDHGTKVTPVDYPDEDGLIFDVEVCQNEGPFPTLAIAASTEAWYGWVSPMLVEEKGYQWLVRPTPSLFIPLETRHGEDADKTEWRKKLIIGHSVGFDRSYLKEQYYIKGPQTYFLDTLSLHMCVSGFTGHQRHSWNAQKAGRAKRQMWMDHGSCNKLEHLYEFYCGQENLDKTARDVFIDGNLNDVRSEFQDLMAYCANDVAVTHEIYSVIWPVYKERFPHPVSFAGMLEMGSAYLPVNESWDSYVRDADYTFEDLEKEMKGILMKLANEACNYQYGERYKSDPWLWSLDWSIQKIPIKTTKTPKMKAKLQEVEAIQNHNIVEDTHLNTSNILYAEDNLLDERALLRFERSDDEDIDLEKVNLETQRINKIIASIPAVEDVMYKRRRHLPGYPLWYRKICPKDRSLGASLVSAQSQVAPILLRMTWDGFPLHFSQKHGWGYLVPGREDNLRTDNVAEDWNEDENVERDSPDRPFPRKSFQALWKNPQLSKDPLLSTDQDEDLDVWEITQSEFWSETEEDKLGPAKKAVKQKKDISPKTPNTATLARMKSLPDHHGVGPFYDVDLPGVWFFRIPHKNGEQYRCGNPLARDYVSKLDDGTMVTAGDRSARRTLVINKMISFWRNGQKRIRSQMAVWFESNDLPTEILRSHEFKSDSLYGAIIPRVITAGTVTRRAVEPTWLTASNPREDRVGSELKSMIRAPPGYSLVGADVDSQELWIAALLGDANFAGMHGSTAFGWMTLQGSKSDGTDLHSVTANTIGISRDHAKVFNYGRIYGAGPRFAERLLLQFNHRLTNDEAKAKAQALYKKTKGTAKYKLSDYGYEIADQFDLLDEVDEDGCVLPKVYWDAARRHRKRGTQEVSKGYLRRLWNGGSESEMFNKLEAIAQSEEPRTPVLNCRISRALEPGVVGKEFITSRVNWIVQSSAVDYLHLMLVCMKWLFKEHNIDGRFCISIHDEVRFLVAVKDKYRAALALQITNLLTRAMFAYKLGIMDLPQSVAFFSSVDIDTVLRKEVTLDNKTPSNPHGLKEGQGVPIGEALNIYQILDKTNNGCLDEKTEESIQSVP